MAYDCFLKLGDGSKAKGESTDSKHSGEIELINFSIGATNPSTVGSSTGGSGAGRVQVAPLNITKKVDKSSPVLFQMCCAGDHFPTATLTVRKAGGKNPLEYLIYTFSQVYIDSYSNVGNTVATEDTPVESVVMSYASVHVKYVPQKADGSGDSPIEGGWDITANQPK